MENRPNQSLIEEIEKTREQLAALDRQLQHRPDFGLGVGSPDIVIWEMNLARRGQLMEHLAELEDALQRSATSDYGRCELCGVTIDPERLRILPYTKRCVRCASMPPGLRTPIRHRQPA